MKKILYIVMIIILCSSVSAQTIPSRLYDLATVDQLDLLWQNSSFEFDGVDLRYTSNTDKDFGHLNRTPVATTNILYGFNISTRVVSQGVDGKSTFWSIGNGSLLYTDPGTSCTFHENGYSNGYTLMKDVSTTEYAICKNINGVGTLLRLGDFSTLVLTSFLNISFYKYGDTLYLYENTTLLKTIVDDSHTASSGWQYSFGGQTKGGSYAKLIVRDVYEYLLSPELKINNTILSPTNNTRNNSNTIIFNYNASAEGMIFANSSLFLNNSALGWHRNTTNQTTITNATINTFSKTLNENGYIWNVEICSTNGFCFFSQNNYTLIIDTTDPTINTGYKDETRFAFRNLTGQFNFSDNNILHSINVTIPELGLTLFNISNISKSLYILNLSYNLSNVPGGIYNLTVIVTDGGTDKKLKSDYEISDGVFNDYLRYDFPDNGYIKTESKSKSILDEWTTKKLYDKYSQTYEPSNPSATQTFIETSDMPIYIYKNKGHHGDEWIVMGNHWKDYVLEDEPDRTIDIKRINKFEVEVTIGNIKNKPERLVFNSIGDLNIVQQNYTFFRENVTETFSSVIFNNFPTTFLLDFNGLNHAEPSHVILNWNNTNFTSSLIISNATLSRYSRSITPSLNFSNRINISHQWYFNLSNVTEVTRIENQTIQTLVNINVSTCDTGTAKFPILNITYNDESNLSRNLSPSNAYNLVIWDGTIFYNQTGTFTTSEPHSLCTNIGPTDLNYSWSMWNTMEIALDGFATRFFNIPKGAPVILSNNPTTNLTITMINETVASTIEYIWTTSEFQPINGIMKIFKCNADGTKSQTDSISIVSSRAVSNVELLTQEYSYTVTIGDTTFSQPSFSTCHVETATSVTYRVNIADVNILPAIGLILTDCSLTKTSNESVEMVWGDNAQSEESLEGCIIAYRDTISGSQKILENCTNSSNTITSTISDTSSAYYVTGELRQLGNTVACGDKISFFTPSAAQKLFGNAGIFASILLIAALILLFVGEGTGFMAAAGVGIVVAWIVGILAFDWVIVSTLIAFLTIIAIIGKRATQV